MSDLFLKESSMEDSYIYKSFNASNSLIEKLVKYIRSGVVLDTSYFEEQYMLMKKTAMSPLSPKVIKSLDEGNLELLFSREVKIGVSVPFIIRKNESGKVVATIFIASFATLDSNDNLNIPVKQLYALLESAFIALEMQKYPAKIQRDTVLMKIVESVYTQMFLRILNKLYALSLDKELYDKVTYCLNRFFLTNLWEYPNAEMIESYAAIELKYISQLDLDLVRTGYTNAEIKDINGLLSYLATLSPRMKELNTRFFIENYVNTYHGSSIMSIDYLPYVFFVITNTILGSFLISKNPLSDIVKSTKGINKFYVELAKIL